MKSKSTSKCVFKVGDRYTHEEVFQRLEVGNSGGIRPCLSKDGSVRRLVIMTSVNDARIHRENPYHDRIEGNTLVFTAAGREGAQNLSGTNKRIAEQAAEPFPIYAFQNMAHRRSKNGEPRRWEFLGLVQYLRHYSETQSDSNGVPRIAQVFEMLIHKEPLNVAPELDAELFREVLQNPPTGKIVDEDRVIVPPSLPPPNLLPELLEKRRLEMLNLEPKHFEHLIKQVLDHKGFERVSVTRYSQDGGIDVNAFTGARFWPVRDLLIQVQAKRWKHTVGRTQVAELRGSLQPHARGAIITTGRFTKSALGEANEAGKNPISLVDGWEFAGILEGLCLPLLAE